MSLTDELRALEEQLLQTASRSNRQAVSELLAEDFIEFGSSGRVWNKRQSLDLLETEGGFTCVLDNFRIAELSHDTVLATYRLTTKRIGEENRISLRSSIWVTRDGRWQVRFHQGTMVPPG